MICLLLIVLAVVRADIDFMDCGSENMIVDKIDVPGCYSTPCRVYKGNSYHLYITPDLIGPRVSELIPYASVVMWGAHIPIPAQCDYPCIAASPRTIWPRGRLNVTIEFPDLLLDRPAELYLWAEYKKHGYTHYSFCVTFQIEIF